MDEGCLNSLDKSKNYQLIKSEKKIVKHIMKDEERAHESVSRRTEPDHYEWERKYF